MNTYYIYDLKKEGAPFYVGMTEHLKQRESEHKTAFGQSTEFEVIDKVFGSEQTALALELTYINKYLDAGHILLNRENKKRLSRVRVNASFAILPDLLESAKEECHKEKISFSSKMEKLVKEYVESRN